MSFKLNPAMNRRSLIAGAAGLGAASILAGCSKNPSAKSGSTAASAAGGSGTGFKIGSIGPLTGATASYGVSVTNGTELGCKHFSQDGLSFQFKKEDSTGSAEVAVNAYNTLMDWGMQALVGPTLTGPSVSVAAECNADRTFMITPSATSEDVTADKDCVFQVCFTDPNQGINAARFLSENYPDEKIGVIYNSGDAYSEGIYNTFKAKAAELKLEIVSEEAFKDESQSSFNNQLTKAQAKGATLIFAPIYYTPASVLLTNAHDMGYQVKMMGCDGMDGILGVEGFDTAYAEGLLLMTPFSADDEKSAEFVKAYQDAYGEIPDQFAADAYDGVHAVAEAIKKSGVALDAAPAEVCEALSKAMLEITVEGITGTLRWNNKGQVEKDPTAYVIKDGKYVRA
ncbi:ABC transporter substrate-binding protein [Collinsella sp. AGMB00827]|uniref:ABC transporter substrate-binding protein n=1 Tax=Collinsella ureilytica TaxID=2869515 RepID=A0ABS7MM39_9ACTN|nr:ABC transporter substrate-binding protein [Collinsella urealyticum]MBY4798141.1 ABC transporter substrate-binding protein [Collinsella urealyticum]